jgi:hypothetical protein
MLRWFVPKEAGVFAPRSSLVMNPLPRHAKLRAQPIVGNYKPGAACKLFTFEHLSDQTLYVMLPSSGRGFVEAHRGFDRRVVVRVGQISRQTNRTAVFSMDVAYKALLVGVRLQERDRDERGGFRTHRTRVAPGGDQCCAQLLSLYRTIVRGCFCAGTDCY